MIMVREWATAHRKGLSHGVAHANRCVGRVQNPGMVSLMEILLESDCRVVFTLLSVVDLAFNQSIPEAIIRIHEVGGAPTVLIKSAITLDLSSTSLLHIPFWLGHLVGRRRGMRNMYWLA
jgi:hypothetical protein